MEWVKYVTFTSDMIKKLAGDTKKKENEGNINARPFIFFHSKWLLFSSERLALIPKDLRQGLCEVDSRA